MIHDFTWDIYRVCSRHANGKQKPIRRSRYIAGSRISRINILQYTWYMGKGCSLPGLRNCWSRLCTGYALHVSDAGWYRPGRLGLGIRRHAPYHSLLYPALGPGFAAFGPLEVPPAAELSLGPYPSTWRRALSSTHVTWTQAAIE